MAYFCLFRNTSIKVFTVNFDVNTLPFPCRCLLIDLRVRLPPNDASSTCDRMLSKTTSANFWPKICRIASPQVIAYMGTPFTIVLKSTNFCFGWVSISFAAHNGITKSSRYGWQKKIVSQIQSNETSRGNALKWSITIHLAQHRWPLKCGFGKKTNPASFAVFACSCGRESICLLLHSSNCVAP